MPHHNVDFYIMAFPFSDQHPPNVQVTAIAGMLHVPCHVYMEGVYMRFVFPTWKWGAKLPQIFGNNFRKFRKFHQFPILVISRKCEDWKMSLYKPEKVRACFCWITEKFQIIQLKISFYDDNFRVDFFQRPKFCHI